MKTHLRNIAPHIDLYFDTDTGIAWVENGTAGISHTAHPNIDASGSARGMKERGYWDKQDRTVVSHGFIYNINQCVIHDEYDRLAAEHCRCGGNHTWTR